MTRSKAMSLAAKWAEGGVCTLRESEMREYHKICLDALRTQQQPNAPLTLDELREMGGEPYYHVSLQRDRVNHWAVLDPFVAEHIEAYHYGERWLAYRRKPEEGTE